MSYIPINTSQNININFTTASVGERMLAFAIDLLIKIAYLVVIGLLFFEAFDGDRLVNRLDSWSIGAIYSILSSPVWLYTLVCESLLEGQTFGKKLMKIKVVKIDGYQASFSDFMMRWVFRLVDVFLSSGIVGISFIIISKRSQRLGDIVAGTTLISLKSKVDISQTILEELSYDYIPVFSQVIALNDNDMRIIKENFQKALKSKDAYILSVLAAKIRTALKLDNSPNTYSDEEFIQLVLKDYNYYTGN